MRKPISALIVRVLAGSPLLTGAVDTKNRDRLENCGMGPSQSYLGVIFMTFRGPEALKD